MIDLSYRSEYRSFLGITQEKLTLDISHADLIFIDIVIGANPHWVNLVEIGTYYGLTTLYLSMCAALRGGQVATFDIKEQRPDSIKRIWPSNAKFIIADVLREECGTVIEYISRKNTFVFFDNGDKPQEARMYAKYLSPGSGFIIHDYETHWTEDDVLPLPDGYSPFMDGIAVELTSTCRCYIRK